MQVATHELKVQPPYFDALLDGSKTFEVRRNDRAYQRGDVLVLNEFHSARASTGTRCDCGGGWTDQGHFTGRSIVFAVTYVYAGDPRRGFGGIEPGYVVLALKGEA
jgi:Domain of unknown function (DUF3850)